MRVVEPEERKWVLDKCRYNPKKIDGENAKGINDVIIQKIIEKSM